MEGVLGRLLLAALVTTLCTLAVLAYIAGIRSRVRSRSRSGGPGRSFDLAQPTLFYFWSTGCTQCRTQEAQIEKARVAIAGKGRVLEVRKIDALVERELAKSMRVMTVPTTVLLDAGGRITAWNPGLTYSKTIENQFNTIV